MRGKAARWPLLLTFRSSRLVLFNECADLFHQFGDHGQGTVHGVVAVRELDGADAAVLNHQECHGLDVDTRAGAAAEQILVGGVLAVEIGPAEAKPKLTLDTGRMVVPSSVVMGLPTMVLESTI